MTKVTGYREMYDQSYRL